MKLSKLLWVCLAVFAIGCGANDVGEECDKAGDAEECVEDAMCTPVGDKNSCLKRCTDDANCATTEACNGVSGTNIKTCQAKK